MNATQESAIQLMETLTAAKIKTLAAIQSLKDELQQHTVELAGIEAQINNAAFTLWENINQTAIAAANG